jgi:hypothetical protein
MKKLRVSDDAIINIVAIVAIVAIVISALIVVAVAPNAGDSVNVFAVGGVTAVAGFLRRPPAAAPNAS